MVHKAARLTLYPAPCDPTQDSKQGRRVLAMSKDLRRLVAFYSRCWLDVFDGDGAKPRIATAQQINNG